MARRGERVVAPKDPRLCPRAECLEPKCALRCWRPEAITVPSMRQDCPDTPPAASSYRLALRTLARWSQRGLRRPRRGREYGVGAITVAATLSRTARTEIPPAGRRWARAVYPRAEADYQAVGDQRGSGIGRDDARCGVNVVFVQHGTDHCVQDDEACVSTWTPVQTAPEREQMAGVGRTVEPTTRPEGQRIFKQ